MKQSRLMSAIEAITNVTVGYGVAVATNWLALPLFGFAVSIDDSAVIGLVFTAVALARSYLLRRFFEWIQVRS